MGIDRFFDQECSIERQQAGGTDAYNQSKYFPFRIASAVDCRVVINMQRILDPKTAEYAWVQETSILLPADTDVQVGDEIHVNGVTPGYTVKIVRPRRRTESQHHVSVLVEALNA